MGYKIEKSNKYMGESISGIFHAFYDGVKSSTRNKARGRKEDYMSITVQLLIFAYILGKLYGL